MAAGTPYKAVRKQKDRPDVAEVTAQHGRWKMFPLHCDVRVVSQFGFIDFTVDVKTDFHLETISFPLHFLLIIYLICPMMDLI